MSAKRESPDILYLIEARLDSGRSKGAPQLNKDIRVLQKAATEIEQLRGDLMAEIHTNDELRAQLAAAKQRLAELEQQLSAEIERGNRLGRDLYEANNGPTHVGLLEQQPRAVPAGCAIVPVEPTGSMLEAGCKQHTCVQHDPWYSDNEISEHDAGKIYRAMLQAAPPPPAQAHCGYTKVESCNDVGCFHLEAGEDHQPPAQAEPTAKVRIEAHFDDCVRTSYHDVQIAQAAGGVGLDERKSTTCRHCNGIGTWIGDGGYSDDQCDHCDGTGKARQ